MRMSASSSTIRMSCAMGDRTQIRTRVRWIGARGAAGCGDEDQRDAGPARLRIFEQQLALMVLHDLLDDGEAQAGAFGPRRDVRLAKPHAPALGQPLAVVLDGDDGP